MTIVAARTIDTFEPFFFDKVKALLYSNFTLFSVTSVEHLMGFDLDYFLKKLYVEVGLLKQFNAQVPGNLVQNLYESVEKAIDSCKEEGIIDQVEGVARIEGVKIDHKIHYLSPVTYTPQHGDQEPGVLIEVRAENVVMVLYNKSRTVQATNPEDLVWG